MAQTNVNVTTAMNAPVAIQGNSSQQVVQQQPNGQVVKQVSPQAIQQTISSPQQQVANPAQPQPQQPNAQNNGQPNKPAPTPVNMAAPQYDVKVVTKGVESFMVSFNFSTTPITQIADYIIISASKHNTSDIHFDPREDGMMVRFRIDGDLQDYTFIPLAYERNLTTRLKLLANMNITESRLPQDGAIKGTFGDTYLDMRVSALPLNEGEKIVIRILDYSRSLQGIDTLGFNEPNLIKLKRMMGIPNGIILTTGATGSGKSTTTYSILQELNKPEVNIITVEDPIEMNIEGINQVQVNAEIGMTFAAALRSILRQDPNVILIGEIRDSETAQIAVRSAITGHLVLSTIHTNNSLATVERLLDMDVERYLLSTAMVGIISQRLAKKVCQTCKTKRPTTPYEKKVFKSFLNKDVNEICEANPKGCEKCRKGYKGRIAIHEVLEFDDELRSALNNSSLSKEELASMVYNGKTISLLQDGLGKILDELTTFSEVYRVIEIETDNPQEDALYGQNLTTTIEENNKNKVNQPIESKLDNVKNTNIREAAVNVAASAATTTTPAEKPETSPATMNNQNPTGSVVTKATNSISSTVIETPKDKIASAIPELDLDGSSDHVEELFEIPDSLKETEISDSAPKSFGNIQIQ